jgi:hypothetical protein
MEKEAVVVYFKILSKHLPGKSEENNENLIQDSQSLGRELNSRTPEYKTVVSPT